ncbi:MAG: hypothetical protein KDA65_14690 [Planctomycetaceae bacterium]|nr:hypothetical protein [Planctomycetaceae bacterium]
MSNPGETLLIASPNGIRRLSCKAGLGQARMKKGLANAVKHAGQMTEMLAFQAMSMVW